ncbi:hypothetical protein OXX80_007092 [Metschnikowia pulcherrima]
MDSRNDTESEILKRKSRSPSVFGEHEPKRPKMEFEEAERSEDIAKQYKKFSAAPKFNLNSEELFCICRKPDVDGELMIICDGCEEWFHTKCMKVENNFTQLFDKFFCKFCQWKGDGVTRWNRKCRQPGCLKPIRKEEKSKYCSDECGEKFMASQLTGSQVLTRADLSFVVNYCGSYTDFQALGAKFPELPEVVHLDLAKLPENVRNKLTEIGEKRKHVSAQYEQTQAKAKYLARVKDMISVVNEKLQALAGPAVADEAAPKSKKKKSKSSKKKRYQNKEQTSGGDLCLQDRRKCLRHSGWFSLLSDKIWKRSTQLQAVLEKLEQQQSETLRDYSIAVYEKEN